jgi:hypothetical protein
MKGGQTQKLAGLLAYVAGEGRVCPQPSAWNKLWLMLPNRTRVGSGWMPPLPLILAAWDHTDAHEKRHRVAEHVEYAASHNCLDEVDSYLRGLRRDQWLIETK